MWKQVICYKYGAEELGWNLGGPYMVGLWKDIAKEAYWISESWKFRIGDGSRVRFWTNHWCSSTTLSISFPSLFGIVANKNETVAEVWDQSVGSGYWNLNLVRSVNDWEVDSVVSLLGLLQCERVLTGWDTVSWKGAGNGIYYVKEVYRVFIQGQVFISLPKVFGCQIPLLNKLFMHGKQLGVKC